MVGSEGIVNSKDILGSRDIVGSGGIIDSEGWFIAGSYRVIIIIISV